LARTIRDDVERRPIVAAALLVAEEGEYEGELRHLVRRLDEIDRELCLPNPRRLDDVRWEVGEIHFRFIEMMASLGEPIGDENWSKFLSAHPELAKDRL
jgi:hypothetical protein